jgi:hypothetical protein
MKKNKRHPGRLLALAVVAVLVIRNPAGAAAMAHHVITALAHSAHSAAHLAHHLRSSRSPR